MTLSFVCPEHGAMLELVAPEDEAWVRARYVNSLDICQVVELESGADGLCGLRLQRIEVP